ncbi:hypothetical protein GCM10011494_14380 [Novosphingobium endophyticum]|uniref:Uncharacterized protein n=1 Tax=Novosphingobium endophyticum TaxID=1955250 RepID=A0A916X535_9SPHN|nr:hypothetical protein [Novosphingobium endophyticum]GGB97033.1 hypothetical protein GCM10011494_14380 [Novosphingobium endophyticum]
MDALTWLWVIGASCLAAELFSRLPFERTVAGMMKCGSRAGWVFSSRRISDHWKETVMPAYAWCMARHTLTLALFFAALAVAIGIVLVLADAVSPEAGRFLASAPGLAASFVVATVYYVLRRRLARA